MMLHAVTHYCLLLYLSPSHAVTYRYMRAHTTVVTHRHTRLRAVRTHCCYMPLRQARIDETEHRAKEEYFKALSKATQLYTKLGKQVTEGTTFFTACQERLDALLNRMRDLQATRGGDGFVECRHCVSSVTDLPLMTTTTPGVPAPTYCP